MAGGNGRTGFAGELERALRGLSDRDKRVVLVGVLNRHLPKGQRAILVGGALVEFYTEGAHTTGDVDVVGESRYVRPLLLSAGFEKSGRHYFSEEFGLAIEVIGRPLRATSTVECVEIRGYEVPVVSVEDAIVDRLLAAKFWKSQTDWEQAILMFASWRTRLRMAALLEKARENDVGDTLEGLRESVRGGS